MIVDLREWYRLHERSEEYDEVRRCWRIVKDTGSTFTTPDERLAAGNRLAELLG